jgi:hypothetical protein
LTRHLILATGAIMPIAFQCSCGQSCSVADEQAGKRVRCPACNAIQTVPLPQAPPPPDAPPQSDLEEIPVVRPVQNVREGKGEWAPMSFEDAPDERRSRRRRDDDDYDDRDRRYSSKSRSIKRESKAGSNASAGRTIVGGFIAIVVAIVWFVVGLAFDRIFFYPPILLILGIIAVVKGMLGKQ